MLSISKNDIGNTCNNLYNTCMDNVYVPQII